MLERIVQVIMVLSGILTLTMLYAFIAPTEATAMFFGEPVSSGAGEIVARNWGLLVSGVGVLLIAGAFWRSWRLQALLVAATSKAAFIAIVLSQGREYVDAAAAALIVDGLAVMVFAGYLLTSFVQRRP